MSRVLTQLHAYPAVGRDADPRLTAVDHLEWLETDGLSGYACSTVTMCPSRRYHGLLTAPLPGTARRHLFLAGLVDALVLGGATVVLSRPRIGGEAAARAGPAKVPPDHMPPELVSFALAPWPTATYQVGGLELRREVLMPKGQHAVLVRYSLVRDAGRAARRRTGWVGDEVGLVLRPLVAFREADQLTFQNEVLRPDVERLPRGISLRCYDALPALTMTLDAPESLAPESQAPESLAPESQAPDGWRFADSPEWWCGVEYSIDLERGYGGHEDLFCPGAFVLGLHPGGSLVFAATIDGEIEQPAALWAAESTRRCAALPQAWDLGSRLALAAEDFLYTGAGGRRGVLAGFPWFGEWGRDTFIALPGLTLARGDRDGCAAVLSGARAFLCDGLLPNIFGATIDDSHYGSVDAALWFARAVQLYTRAGGERERVLEDYYPALVGIAEAYCAGTAPRIAALGIRADDGGLLVAGSPDLNPTWMDALPPGGPVTPRHGCPVEICALWYALLAQLADLAGERGDAVDQQRWSAAKERAGASFLARFWSAERGFLADVWRPAGVDASLRPNMVLAAALEQSPLDRSQRAGVVAAAERALLTPFGLRTLAPDDPAYTPHYRGGPAARDAAYHQGTVWPWLLGFYVEAALRAAPQPADGLADGPADGPADGLADAAPRATPRAVLQATLRAQLAAFDRELEWGGLNHINEVYDGAAPHRRGGTFAQAWSTAEILRALALLDGRLPL